MHLMYPNLSNLYTYHHACISTQVYGAFFSYLFLHEELGLRGLGGAALIMLGLWISATASAREPVAVIDSVTAASDVVRVGSDSDD